MRRAFSLGIPKRRLVSLLMVVGMSFCVAAQQRPTSDPYAVALANQAMASLTGRMSIADVTLNATVNAAGDSSGQSGTAVFRARAGSDSRVETNLNGKMRTETRTVNTGTPVGAWAGDSGTATVYPLHNCLTDAAWFFPAMSSLSQSANPSFIFKYVGQTQRNGVSTQQLRVFQVLPSGVALPQQLTAVDFYLDAATLIPVATTFNVHPDRNAGENLLVDVEFSNYQVIQGIRVPMRIQRYQQGALMLDATISSVSFNKGLDQTLFQITKTN